ncbi:hypothetical protein GOA86_17565 [Sinorhizobium meliloti]|nr:hypothetical protein [Sinorhizobium meliloti]
MKKLAVVTCAAVIGSLIPAHAETVFDRMEEIPFIKAYAYAEAVDDYCFATKKFSNQDLAKAASLQEDETALNINTAVTKAKRHLAGDQSACAPAMTFIDRTVAELPGLKQQFEAMIVEKREFVATQRAILQEAAKAEARKAEEAREAEAARARAETMERVCPALSEMIEAGAKGDPTLRLGTLSIWIMQFKQCRGFFEPAKFEALTKKLDDDFAATKKGISQ